MEKNKNIFMSLLLTLIILVITIVGVSYAYFGTRINNPEESTTITTGSGIIEIVYSGGENINVPNIFPKSDPFIIKNFTLSGKNSSEDLIDYHVVLVLDNNTFRNDALTYTLESNNTGNNGEVIPPVTNQVGIPTGKKDIILGSGNFTNTSKQSKVHEYILKLYFPYIENFDHGVDQGKDFAAHIEIREGYKTIANNPVLFTGMTPIKWDDNNNEIETTEDDPDWYDYDEKRWANAKSADGSYWVWIPRYAYKIESCYHTSAEDCLALTGKEAGDIDVKFLRGKTNQPSNNTNIESEGYVAGTKDTSMVHFLHPAFDFDDGYTGFWVAKFEATAHEELLSGTTEGSCDIADNVLTKSPLIAPNEISWRCINVSNAYKTTLAMKDNPLYEWLPEEVDTHMMTNHEWGAVAYLSKSQYGASDEVWNNSYTGFKTGCSGPSVSASNQPTCDGYEYDTQEGVKASTTHNIYGVYDMSGGAWEYVMGYYNEYVGSSGFSSNELSLIGSKHITRYYTAQEDLLDGTGVDYDLTIYGDAINETSANAHRRSPSNPIGAILNSWYYDYSNFPYIPGAPWFLLGGAWSQSSRGGIFALTAAHGGRYWDGTFRPILTPL